MSPVVKLSDKYDACSGAALIAEVGSLAGLVVEAETILPAAHRARAMTILQEPHIDAELRENFPPPAAGALDRVHAARAFAFA